MNFEPGDYFVVVKGEMLTPEIEGVMGTQPAQYDCTWEGGVYEVLKQEGDFIAALIVFPHEFGGQSVHMDISKMEVMPVSQHYIAALKKGSQYRPGFQPKKT